MLFHERYEKVLKELFENIPYCYNSDLLNVMQEYSEPSEIHPYRYDYGITYRTDAFKEACNKFNRKMATNYHIETRHNVFEPDKQDEDSLIIQPIYYLFSIIELQFKELSTDEANDFADAINNLFKDNELPWLLSDGKLIKIDAKQFECDLMLKAIESLKELKDAEPKFQSAYTELTDAIEYLDKGDYQSAINNAGKSYESILNDSNFKIAIVVDMWITGFDVPSLSVMYIDKPLQKHTLIQTISRVNRVFEGKDKGLVVDYIGIKDDMMQAVKVYVNPKDNPIDELKITLEIFRNHLKLLDDLLITFDASKYYSGKPIERLYCLNSAVEYVQENKERQTRFMGLSRRLKAAYQICLPSGELTDKETVKAQFYLAVRSIIYKQTKPHVPDTETMNRAVENMVRDAIACTGVENIIDADKQMDFFSEDFLKELKAVNLPITEFNALLKLLHKAITDYGRTNKVKAIAFDERLKKVVEVYNSRDKLVFTSEVVADFVNDLSEQLITILHDLQEDKASFEKMGITYEEKAFYDILVKVRDDHEFKYEDEKCLVLAKKIKELVDDKVQFADWSTREDIKNQMNMDLTILLYKNGYPPEWDEEVFEKVLEQAENFKKYSD